MLGLTLLALTTATDVRESCDADDGVCLLQFMEKGKVAVDHDHDSDHLLTFDEIINNYDFDALDKNPEGHYECPGAPVYAHADVGYCSKEGVAINVDEIPNVDQFPLEEVKNDIRKYFGDNVYVKELKYYMENCDVNPCEYEELIGPTVNGHHFPVGISHVKVEGFDLAENSADCTRTVYVYDTQPPTFNLQEDEVDSEITIPLHHETCDVTAHDVFNKYNVASQHAFTTATDHCDPEVEVVFHIHDEQGNCVYDSRHDDPSKKIELGPGESYSMVYEAIDDHTASLGLPEYQIDGKPAADGSFTTTTHTVTLILKDVTEPYNFTGCPSDKTYEIEAHETQTVVEWEPPTATGDNCDAYQDLPDAIETSHPTKYPGMIMEVGSHPVRYKFEDASGNDLGQTCIFTITVIQKAHPVTVECPADVFADTVEQMRTGIALWPDPVATQGPRALDMSHVTYIPSVASGMLFPYGVTTITINVTGEETGERTEEHLRWAECTFVVTIGDPFDPKVDGREYRCKDADSVQVRPFAICDGPELQVDLDESYRDNGAYDVLGVITRDSQSCCLGEDDQVHMCVPVPESTMNKYCHR
jgi:hypothetical protein